MYLKTYVKAIFPQQEYLSNWKTQRDALDRLIYVRSTQDTKGNLVTVGKNMVKDVNKSGQKDWSWLAQVKPQCL